MIEVAPCKIWGSQFVKKIEIDQEKKFAFLILLRLSNKFIPKRIGLGKLKIRQPNCIYNYPECVLQYIGHLASRNIVGEIWADIYKVSFADFWTSVDLPHL